MGARAKAISRWSFIRKHMTRAVGNHSSASADYSLLRKMRFLSCRNSIMKKKKKKKKCSASGFIRFSSLHFGGFHRTLPKTLRSVACVHLSFFFPPLKKNKIQQQQQPKNPTKSPCWQLNAAGMMSLEQLEEKREKQVCVC